MADTADPAETEPCFCGGAGIGFGPDPTVWDLTPKEYWYYPDVTWTHRDWKLHGVGANLLADANGQPVFEVRRTEGPERDGWNWVAYWHPDMVRQHPALGFKPVICAIALVFVIESLQDTYVRRARHGFQ